MIAIDTLLRQPAAQAVGWALLQFVWQGAAVGALTALALLALRRSASDVRYVVASIGLALMLTLPVVGGVQKFQSLRDDAVTAETRATTEAAAVVSARSHELPGRLPTAASMASVDRASTTSLLARLQSVRVEPLLPTLMLVWLIGVSLLSLRLLTGWLWVQRLKTHRVSAADDSCVRMTARLSKRLHISRAITLLESALVDVPTVIGFMKPVILLPASVLGGLTPQQLEAILAHELAHIRRHDYLVNLLQTLVETVLFYHPAVWWLSGRIRIERENCCDDLAVSLCGDPVAYANALADLESLRPVASAFRRKHHDHIAMAATGGSLLQRVRRLLGAPSSHTGRAPAWLAGSVALLLIGGIALGAYGVRNDETHLAATPVASAAAAPAVAVSASTAPVASTPRVALVSATGQATTTPNRPSPYVETVPVSVPPVPPTGGQSISHRVNDSQGNWTWSSNGEKLEVKYSGAFAFTDDDTDIKEISQGGYIKISDGNWVGRHSVEIRERGGQIERRYFANFSERPYEPGGRVWLQQNLPKFVRNTGIGAPSRVGRYLKSGGVPAVMGEIGRISSSYVKGIYFRELFKQATLTAEQYRTAMAQASREISSDYELAQLLIAVADRLPSDEVSRAAYFTAASSISSDYELRRVYSTMLKRGPVGSQTLGNILQHSTSIDSDYELSELLRQILSQQALDDKTRAAFFRAAGTISSDYERHRVLSGVVKWSPDAATLEAALNHAETMRSDHESATFLHEVLKFNGVDGASRAPFFRVVNRLSSGYERGRVLQAVVKRPGVGADTLREVLRAAKGMSGYELSQVLQTVARDHTVSGDLREAYLDAADRLSGYEQGQVLTALVKSERRK